MPKNTFWCQLDFGLRGESFACCSFFSKDVDLASTVRSIEKAVPSMTEDARKSRRFKLWFFIVTSKTCCPIFAPVRLFGNTSRGRKGGRPGCRPQGDQNHPGALKRA